MSNPAPFGQKPEDDSSPFGRAHARQASWRTWAALAVLLALLGLVLYSIYHFTVNRALPIPGLGRTSEEAVLAPQYLYSISGPDGDQALAAPLGVEVSRDDRVYVTDSEARVVRVYTVEGEHLFSFNEIADGEYTTLGVPVFLAINSKDELFVTDRRHRAIYVFTLDGEFVRKVVPADPEEARVWGPLGLGFDENDNLYVTDVGRRDMHQIIVFDENGVEVRRFGSSGQAEEISQLPGLLSFPNDMVVMGDEIFVSDSNNRRIQVFDAAGRFDRIIRTSGIPRGMDVDADGRIYVADALAHQVDIYTAEGDRITGFGESGIGLGQFRYTNDLALGSRDRIFVTDRLNHRVQVWGWPEPVPFIPELPDEPADWWMCLLPLLLLPLLFLLRRTKFAVTEDFLVEMANRGRLSELGQQRRRVFIVPEAHRAIYVGRELDGVPLDGFLKFVKHSESDLNDLVSRLGVDRDTALMLVVARTTRRLCTEDRALAVAARTIGVDTYDGNLFTERFMGSEAAVDTEK